MVCSQRARRWKSNSLRKPPPNPWKPPRQALCRAPDLRKSASEPDTLPPANSPKDQSLVLIGIGTDLSNRSAILEPPMDAPSSATHHDRPFHVDNGHFGAFLVQGLVLGQVFHQSNLNESIVCIFLTDLRQVNQLSMGRWRSTDSSWPDEVAEKVELRVWPVPRRQDHAVWRPFEGNASIANQAGDESASGFPLNPVAVKGSTALNYPPRHLQAHTIFSKVSARKISSLASPFNKKVPLGSMCNCRRVNTK